VEAEKIAHVGDYKFARRLSLYILTLQITKNMCQQRTLINAFAYPMLIFTHMYGFQDVCICCANIVACVTNKKIRMPQLLQELLPMIQESPYLRMGSYSASMEEVCFSSFLCLCPLSYTIRCFAYIACMYHSFLQSGIVPNANIGTLDFQRPFIFLL
jgi:hypothetical protein